MSSKHLPEPSNSARCPAWACVAINQLAFPGLGTIMAGRRVGYLQALLMVAGFVLFMGYFVWFATSVIRFLQSGDETAWRSDYRQYPWAWQWALVLCALAWLWALVSSIGILRGHRG